MSLQRWMAAAKAVVGGGSKFAYQAYMDQEKYEAYLRDQSQKERIAVDETGKVVSRPAQHPVPGPEDPQLLQEPGSPRESAARAELRESAARAELRSQMEKLKKARRFTGSRGVLVPRKLATPGTPNEEAEIARLEARLQLSESVATPDAAADLQRMQEAVELLEKRAGPATRQQLRQQLEEEKQGGAEDAAAATAHGEDRALERLLHHFEREQLPLPDEVVKQLSEEVEAVQERWGVDTTVRPSPWSIEEVIYDEVGDAARYDLLDGSGSEVDGSCALPLDELTGPGPVTE
eukprot:gene8840-10478_t